MKIVFFGTGKFSISPLKALLETSHEIVGVVTQPDKKKGRGWNTEPTLVKAFLEKASPGMEVLQPESTSSGEFMETLKVLEADLFVVVDYGQILKKEVLEVPKKYAVNLHPSLLPKYRGASPVNRVILEGEVETGSTVIKMNERMDAGDIILQEKTPIAEEEDAESLLARLSKEGASLLVKALGEIEEGKETLTPQDEAEATYAPKLTKAEGEIDWTSSSSEIVRKVKAMKPWPAAYTFIEGKILKVISARKNKVDSSGATPGSVLSDNEFIVSSSGGAVILETVQLEGKKAMASSEFLKGFELKKGTVLGAK